MTFFKTTTFKTTATALVLALATVTVADAATTRPAAIHGVAGKTPVATSVAKRHHVARHMADHLARRDAFAHHVRGTKLARTQRLRHVAENHRVSAKTSVVR